MPFSVRLSATATNLPVDSSCVITGSRLEIASISPFSMAATAPEPAPTPTTEMSVGLNPPLARMLFTNMLVEEPGAVTPTLRPLRSAGPLYFAALSLGSRSTMELYLACSTTALMGCFFAAMLMVCS